MTDAKTKDQGQAMACEYPFAHETWVSFGWICTECRHVNYMNWTHYTVYGDVKECSQCEKAHKVKVPFR